MRLLFYILAIMSSISCIAKEEIFSIKSGDYELKISKKYKYTIRQIKYKDTVLGTRSGFYGTVMAYDKGKYTGAGHSEGGFEKVLKFEFLSNGKKVVPETGKTYTADNFKLNKTSLLDKLCFQTEISLSPEGIIERKRFTATAMQPVHLIYIYLLCWNKETNMWLAEGQNGEKYSGEFKGEFAGTNKWHLQKDIKWAANFDAKNGKGMLMYYPEVIPGEGRKSAFWEVKNAYNKYYLMLKSPKSYPEGYTSPVYTLILKGFTADKSNFTDTVDQTVKETAKMELPVMNKAALPEKKEEVSSPKNSIKDTVSFDVDYTESTSTTAGVSAQKSQGDPQGKVLLADKAKFDFDNMAHTVRGLAIGTEGSTVRYSSQGNIPTKAGSIELVIKAEDWKWNDEKVHVFMQSSIPQEKGTGKFYIYKYKTSGLAFYIEKNKTGEKAFLNHSVKNWKDKSWHHLIASYGSEEVSLYIDGIKVKAAQIGSIESWAKYFYIGPASEKFGYDGKSTVCMVKIYDRQLSDDEVKALAKERLPELKIDVSAANTSITGEKIIGEPSPWFKERPKLGMKALEDDTVLPPWTPVNYANGKVAVWGREYDFTGQNIISSITTTDTQLINAPVKLQINVNGKVHTVSFGAPEIIRQGKGRVILQRKSLEAGKLKASIKYMIEFDGMIWNTLTIEPEKQEITGIKLLVPFAKENAKFIHYVGAPKTYESQDLVKNSFSKALEDKTGMLFQSGFKTNVWIGNNERGLLWFAESEQNWWPKERENMVEVSRNSDGNIELALNMVSENIPYGNKAELTYKFGFMATPVKPLPKGWRGMTFSAQYDSFTNEKRGNCLIYWPNEWRWMMLDPEPHRALNLNKNRIKVEKDSTEKRKIIPYWTRLHYPVKDKEKVNSDAIKMQKEWSTIPGRPGGGSHQMYRAACTSGWTDYLVWCVDQWPKVMGNIDGIYMDETQPIPNSKALSGGGYDDLAGSRGLTFEIFGSRNLIKRINYNIWQRNKKAPLSIAHCSATHTMPTLSMYTVMLIGEQYYSGYFKNRNPEFLPPNEKENLYYYSYALPMDRLRAECYWKQWGAVMVWLPCLKDQKEIMKNPIPTRDMLSRIMQADMLVWPLFCDSREVYKTWKFRREFNIADPEVEFVPYWENEKIESKTKDAVVGYYKNKDKYLVLVSNLNRSAKDIELIFKGIFLNSAKNAETGKTIEIKDKNIKLNIPRNDYIALRINY